MDIVALYGGSFDPPHIGHVEVVRRVLEMKTVIRIIVIPSRKPPHKTPVASYRRRLFMINSVMSDVFRGEPVTVSNIEASIRETTYTVEILRSIPYFRNSRYALVLGTDEVRSIMSWKCPEEVLDKAGPIIINRPGMDDFDKNEFLSSNIMTGASSLAIEDAPVIDVDEAFWVSSSDVRGMIASGNGRWKTLVPRLVAQYVEKNGLYGYKKKEAGHG